MNQIKLNTDNYVELHLINEKDRPFILIAPGGGYRHTSKREADPIAKLFNDHGYHAGVIYYRETLLKSDKTTCELASFVSNIRAKASINGINPNQIILMGFSSGGHYMARLGVLYQEIDINSKPNGLILAYPVISGKKGIAHEDSIERLFGETNEKTRHEFSLENHVGQWTPKTFIFHTVEDKSVPYQNSLVFFEALNQNKVPCELHLYDKGEHGLSLGTKEVVKLDYPKGAESYDLENKHFQTWANLLISWLSDNYK